ncbi:MAG TPA: ParB/RepB/Spo0J family partition protein [Methylomirabilota bacterium]|nr:ParB/RepB/Spo0J family partition protein [Methylomirabilota bacterium]
MAKPALGRGLGALLGGTPPAANRVAAAPVSLAAVPGLAPGAPATPARDQVQQLPLERVRPCAFQPRKEFDPEALQELADSIREQGVIQPLIVRPRGDHYELIAGERRWRAAQLLGLKEVPAIVREADDRAVLELALIENLQRENLNPIEEAQGYAQLVGQFGLRQDDVATRVGKSRAVVANALRLLKLDPELQNYVRDGRLSVGHAKVILGLSHPAQQRLAAERVLKAGLNVRQTEELVAHLQQASADAASSARAAGADLRDANVVNLESRLRERFGTKVQLRYRQGKGALEIRFFSDDELDRILQIVGVTAD